MLIPITDIELIYKKVLKSINIDYISVVIYVSFDVDSICSLKIITRILKSQNILYQIYPVSSYTQLDTSIQQTKDLQKVKMIFFINCGGIIDLTQKWFIKQNDKILIFLLDSHKPINHRNIEHQNIKIIDDGFSQFNNHPTSQQIAKLQQIQQFQLQSSNSDSQQQNKQQDQENQNINKRKRRRKKEYKNQLRKHKNVINKKINDYYGMEYSSAPSSFIAYRLARDINKHNNDILWYAIIGLTSLYIQNKISKDVYQKNSEPFRSEMIKLNQIHQDELKSVGYIYQQLDFRFCLLRHWSLYQSMLYSPYMVKTLKLWDQKGKKRLNQLLTHIGISLQQANQLYKYMSRQSKLKMREQIFNRAEQFQLYEITFNSFSRQVDYAYSLSSSDCCYAIIAALQKSTQFKSNQELQQHKIQNFWRAYQILQKGNLSQILDQIQNYKKFLKILITQSINIIERKQIIPCQQFIYVKIKNDIPETEVFEHPESLIRLGYNLLGIYHEIKNKKSYKPIVIGIQNHYSKTCTVAGVVTDSKNPFGSKFLKVAQKNKFECKKDNFLGNIIIINKQDFLKFILELNLT